MEYKDGTEGGRARFMCERDSGGANAANQVKAAGVLYPIGRRVKPGGHDTDFAITKKYLL